MAAHPPAWLQGLRSARLRLAPAWPHLAIAITLALLASLCRPSPATLPPPQYFRSPAQLLVHDRPTADPLVMSSGLGVSSDADVAAAPAGGHAGGNGGEYSGTPAAQQLHRRAADAKPVRPAY